jgi:tRNA 2-selenouridine synthase
MRSQAVVGLLSAFGYRVSQMPGGYKAFRNHVLTAFARALPPRLVVIHGQTGVGKTLILRRLANHLDLEDCAQHRSSVFGAINLRPRTQQQFEAHLLAALEGVDYARLVWVEGESRKIGDAIMPDPLRQAMQAAPCVLVTAALATRVARIVAEYGRPDAATHGQWETALRQLTVPLGRERVADLIARVRANDFAPVVETLLLDYYDSRYRHAMRNYRYALTVDSGDLDAAVAALEDFARVQPTGGGEEPGARPVPGAGERTLAG